MKNKTTVIIVVSLALALALLCAVLAPKIGSRSWQEYYDLGIRYLNEGNYEKAILAFNAAIEIEPRKTEAYLALSDVYLELGDTEKAISILEDALSSVENTEAVKEKIKRITGESESEEPSEDDAFGIGASLEKKSFSEEDLLLINDEENILSTDTIYEIAELNAVLNESCSGAKIAVVTLKSSDAKFLSACGQEFVENSNIGREVKRNGMLLLVVPDENNAWLTPGTDFHEMISAHTIRDWLRDFFWPAYHAENYDAAVLDMLYKAIIPFYAEFYGIHALDEFIDGTGRHDAEADLGEHSEKYDGIWVAFSVPDGFELEEPIQVNGYRYSFYNASLNMRIVVSEISFASIDPLSPPESILSRDHEYFKSVGKETFIDSENYILSGYYMNSDDTFFYMQLYDYYPGYITVEITYPIDFRYNCDVLALDFLASLHGR